MLSVVILNFVRLSVMLSIIVLNFVEKSVITPSVVILNFVGCYAECRFSELRWEECFHAECHYSELR
jgi:hypothetical protein